MEDPRRESDLGVPQSRRVTSGVGEEEESDIYPHRQASPPPSRPRPAPAPLPDIDIGYKAQIDFLTDQVRRLNSALSEYQARYPEDIEAVNACVTGAQPSHEGALSGTDPLPPWLVSPQYLTPLMTAYDVRLKDLSDRNRLYEQELMTLKQYAERVVEENEYLHGEVKRYAEALVQKTDEVEKSANISAVGLGVSQVAPQEVQELEERLDLLTEENDILIEQQRKTSSEMERLRVECLQKNSEISQLCTELNSARQEIQGLTFVTNDVKILEKENRALIEELEKYKKEVKDVTASLVDHKQKFSEASLRLQSYSRENERLTKREMEVEGRAIAVDSSLNDLYAKLERNEKEIEQLTAEKGELVTSMSTLQNTLAAVEQRELDAYNHVKESIEMVETARLERDQGVMREEQLTRELNRVTEKLTKMQESMHDSYSSDIGKLKSNYEIQISKLMDEVTSLELACADLQAQADRAIRDKRAAESELEKLCKETPEDIMRLNSIIDEINGRLKIYEKDRDEAIMKYEHATSEFKKKERLLEKEKASYTMKAEEERRKMRNLERELEESKEDKFNLIQSYETAQKELRNLMNVKAALEWRLSSELEGYNRKMEQVDKTHKIQLDQAQNNIMTSNTELQNLWAAQQKNNAQWREESKNLTIKFETLVGDLKSEVSGLKIRNRELTAKLESAGKAEDHYELNIAESRKLNNKLRRLLKEAEDRVETCTNQINGLLAKEKELLHDRKRLQREVEYLKMTRDRAVRDGPVPVDGLSESVISVL
eukprot:Nk52_evm9s1705 gene=Nk52_evmTU9s1705